jgi:Uncharacterised protein family (UPF0172)
MQRYTNQRQPIFVTVTGRKTPPPNSHPSGYQGMSAPIFRLDDLAYTKLIVPALKYPHKTVTGLLLGQRSSDGPVEIVDAVPLQHHWTNLSPMMEVGLGMVRSSSLRRFFETDFVYFAR